MNKADYKKALVDIRNSYIDLNKQLKSELETKQGKMEEKISEYLNKKSFNLLSKKNIILRYLGIFIVYKLLKNNVSNGIADMIQEDFSDYFLTYMQIESLNSQSDNINNAISFLDSVSQEQLDKYLSYKIN